MIVEVEHRFGFVAARLLLIRLLAFGVGDASMLQAVQRESLLARDHLGIHRGVDQILPGVVETGSRQRRA